MRKIAVTLLVALGLLVPATAASADTFSVGDRWTYGVIHDVKCKVTDVTTDSVGGQTVDLACQVNNKKYPPDTGQAYVAPDGSITFTYWTWWQA